MIRLLIGHGTEYQALVSLATIAFLASSVVSQDVANHTLERLEDCQWPECTPGCIPCKDKMVGTCMLSYMHSTFACKSSRGPTECVLGKCLCAEKYCASDDGTTCVPQICTAGAKPTPYKPQSWTRLFAKITNFKVFPEPDQLLEMEPNETEISEDFFIVESSANGTVAVSKHYIKHVMKLPIKFVACGVFIAFILFVVLCWACRYTPPPKGTGDGTHSRLSGDSGDLASDPEQAGAESVKNIHFCVGCNEKRPTKPSVLPMLVIAFLIVATCLLGVRKQRDKYQWNVDRFYTQFTNLYKDASTVAGEAELINSTVDDLHQILLDIPASCKVSNPLVDHGIHKLQGILHDALDGYVTQVNDLADIVQPIPGLIGQGLLYMEEYHDYLTYGPLVPVFVATLVSVFAVFEALCVLCCKSSLCARLEDCGLRLSAIIHFILIVAISIISAVELTFCVAVSGFCFDIDTNALNYIGYAVGVNESVPYNLLYNTSRYYIRGDVANPIIAIVVSADKYISEIEKIWTQLTPQIQMAAVTCPGISKLNLDEVGATASLTLGRVMDLLEARNIYPYYEEMLRTGTCGGLTGNFAWLLTFTTLTGLVLYPLCAAATHRFLVRWIHWRQYETQGEDSDEEDEESDDNHSDEEEDGEKVAVLKQERMPSASNQRPDLPDGPELELPEVQPSGKEPSYLAGADSTLAAAASLNREMQRGTSQQNSRSLLLDNSSAGALAGNLMNPRMENYSFNTGGVSQGRTLAGQGRTLQTAPPGGSERFN